MSRFKEIIVRCANDLRAHLKAFQRSERGVAAIEFAFVMPLMILLYFGTVDGSRMLTFDRRLNSATATMGDLVARTKDSLTTTELNDYFLAARMVMVPYSSATLTQVVSCVYVDEFGAATVVWSYADNGGTAHAVSSSFTLPAEYLAIASDTYVIVSEATVQYAPLTNLVFPSTIQMSDEQYYIPRFGGIINVV